MPMIEDKYYRRLTVKEYMELLDRAYQERTKAIGDLPLSQTEKDTLVKEAFNLRYSVATMAGWLESPNNCVAVLAKVGCAEPLGSWQQLQQWAYAVANLVCDTELEKKHSLNPTL